MNLEKRVRSDGPSSLRGQVVRATDREVQEATARCVSVMVYYHNEKRSPTAQETMTAEIQTIADWFAMLCLSVGELSRDLFRRVEAELIVRYGRLVGGRLNQEFLAAFEAGWADQSI